MTFEDVEHGFDRFLDELVQVERRLDDVHDAEKRRKVKQAIETIRSLWEE